MQQPCRLEIAPCPAASVAALIGALGCSDAVAQVLVRRGLGDPEVARAWLAADDRHSPEAMPGMAEAVMLVRSHLDAGSRIVVHGDYDVDGVCSTAILVRALRSLGADPAFYLPDRATDGYGLNAATVDRLAAQSTGLLITVDCAITAVDEVARARAAGIDVLVTDHHSPRADGVLPDAPIVHPALGDAPYPCRELCAAAVAAKLAEALGAASVAEDGDLVALATVADVVVLRGENRRLVREGVRALAATRKPGLRALMRVARAEPSKLDATAVAFRLAPRINAAGRLARADAALELILTGDETRAETIAQELDRLNGERRFVEQRMLFEAEAQVAQQDGAIAHVVAGEDWHAGVAGIVASRIAERYHRPAVVICIGDDGRATGSARSISAYDLLGGLNACAQHLTRHGGHRAAAGLEMAADAIPAFAAALCAHAESVLTEGDLVATQRVDAVVSGGDLGLELAEELGSLAPFGHGNAPVRLLLPAAQFTDPRTMGEGKHLRCTVQAGGVRCRAVAFSTTRLPVGPGEPADAVVALELDDWGGAVELRLVLRHVQACVPAPIEVLGEPSDWLGEALEELDAALPGALGTTRAPAPTQLTGAPIDRRDRGVAGTVAACVASGEPTLVICADTTLRRNPLSTRLGGFALTDWAALQRDPALAGGHVHVVAVDPPPSPAALAHITVMAWGAAELDFATKIHQREHSLRPELTSLYRSLRAAGGAGGERLETLLRGDSPHRSPALAGRALRILEELGLVTIDRAGRTLTVPLAQPTQLERSETFRAYEAAGEDRTPFVTTAKPRTAAAA